MIFSSLRPVRIREEAGRIDRGRGVVAQGNWGERRVLGVDLSQFQFGGSAIRLVRATAMPNESLAR